MKKNIKKFLLTLSVVLELFAIISCSDGSSSDDSGDIAGYDALKKSVPETSKLLTSETWIPISGDDISVLAGKWISSEIEYDNIVNPKYAYLNSITVEIVENETNHDKYDRIDTFTYDLSAAVADSGESVWEDFKESGELPAGYLISDIDHIAMNIYVDINNPFTSIDDCFGNFFYPNSREYYFNANQKMFRIDDKNSLQSTIYIKQ